MKLSSISSSSFITIYAPPPHRKFPLTRPRISFSTQSSTQNRVKLAESLQSESLKILEWPAVCKQLAAFTSTSMGLTAAQSARIPVGRSSEESRKLLAQTSAAVAFPKPLDFSGIEDISPIVDAAVTGELLSIRELCAVKRTLRAARSLFQQLEAISSDNHLRKRCSPLLEILQNCNFLMGLEQKIDFCIDCNFFVVLDQASEELEIIRLERKTNMETLESLLKQVSSQIFQAGGIDRPVVTKRRFRMCVAIRASHRSLLPDGIILDSSSSGATYFMEPKEAVDLNNMEVRLSTSEKIEEQAIMSLLTSEISQSAMEIDYLLEKVMEVDLAFARATHSQWLNGVCPMLGLENFEGLNTDSLSVDIQGIQHPLLLEPALRKLSYNGAFKFLEKSSTSVDQGNASVDSAIISSTSDLPVPVDIKVGHGTKVVVISGPNTGGKTASMKTLGLASIMLKAGMYLPAKDHPRLPWFDLILVDIGDQQSLEHSLSTFSGHISRICKILDAATENSLVLIDEIGCGTDPSEGVALSASILQYLKDRVHLAVVTTHYADLTHLKEKDTRFENAAMEFSLETLKPTYRILWGSTGESNALSIAKSIGFDGRIIERAQSWVEKLTPQEMQKRKGLLYQSLLEERNKIEVQARKAASFHSDVMDLYREIKKEAEDLDGREAALKAKETQQIHREVSAAKTEIEAVVWEFEKKLRNTGVDHYNLLLKEAESAIAAIVEAHQPSDDISVLEYSRSSYKPQLRDQVYIEGLGHKGATVVEAPSNDGTILVQYGKVRVRVNASRIRAPVIDRNTALRSMPRSKTQRITGLRNLGKLSQTSTTEEVSYGPVVQTSKNTINLRGMRVVEASHQLNMAINARGSNSVLFIVHGMGTGAVKECAMQVLRNHPRVAKFDQESPTNYGCTVAYIK